MSDAYEKVSNFVVVLGMFAMVGWSTLPNPAGAFFSFIVGTFMWTTVFDGLICSYLYKIPFNMDGGMISLPIGMLIALPYPILLMILYNRSVKSAIPTWNGKYRDLTPIYGDEPIGSWGRIFRSFDTFNLPQRVLLRVLTVISVPGSGPFITIVVMSLILYVAWQVVREFL